MEKAEGLPGFTADTLGENLPLTCPSPQETQQGRRNEESAILGKGHHR